MSDIVNQLRAYGGNDSRDYRHVAADLIEQLERENAELREAIKPFANLPDNANGKSRYFLQLLICPDGDEPVGDVKDYGRLIRRARRLAEQEGME